MEDRRERLKKVLSGQELEPEAHDGTSVEAAARARQMSRREIEDRFRLRHGRLVGHGRWGTRINWGFWVLVTGFVLYLLTVYVAIPMANKGGW